MADYSKIFAGSGGLLNAFSDRSSIVNFTTSLAETAAIGLYMKNYTDAANMRKNTGTGRDLPSGLEFLTGDNIVSDVLRGGYQPHVGSYIAHKVGAATFQAMNAVFDIFSPGMSKSFQRRYEELKKVTFDSKFLTGDNREELNTKLVLDSFNTIAKQHPEKFQEVFYKEFNSAYLSGDRFFCLLEYDNLLTTTDGKATSEISRLERDQNPIYNRHYQAFLVKNVTIPSSDVENVEITRFNQKFSIQGNTGQNESISVNYLVDYHQTIYRKLYESMRNLSFVTDTSRYFTMYLIINNPYQFMSSDPTVNGLPSANSLLAKTTWGQIPNGKNNILAVWKFKGVHVKNINQVTYDTATPDFINLPVVFNHNGMEVELFGYDFGKNNEYSDKNSQRYDWLMPAVY